MDYKHINQNTLSTLNLSWFERLSIKTKFLLLMLGGISSLIILALISLKSIHEISVNGPVYKTIKDNQDLVADIMPPPMYLVDAAFQLQLYIQHADNEIHREPYKLSFENDLVLFKSSYNKWSASDLDESLKVVATNEVLPPASKFIDLATQKIIPYIEENNQTPPAEILDQLESEFNLHRSGVDHLLNMANKENQRIETATAEEIQQINALVIGVVSVVSAICLFFIWRVYLSMQRTLGGEPFFATQVVSTISNGNLSQAISVGAKRQTSLLGQMEKMRFSLRDLIQKIQNSSHELHVVSDEVTQLGNHVLTASTKQSHAASSIAATVEEMTCTIREITNNSERVLDLTTEAELTANQGSEMIADLIGNIDVISKEVGQVANEVSELGDKTQAISAIVTTIKAIADQTNLLALNAAIEAARAGESGRGFAVVADEVRMLAERTADSTREVDNMINAIQMGMDSVVKQIAMSVEHVGSGVRSAERANVGIQAISEKTSQVTTSVRDVMIALSSQSGAIDDAAHHVEHVARMSEDNNQAIQAVNERLSSLASLAILLEANVQRFRVS